MRADGLDHAIELQNAVEYGLTGGIHTLDDAEVEHWLDRVEVGNAYVNRHTTGAVVRRQPFGGWKRSSVGRGAKTGGPDDILRFTTFQPALRPLRRHRGRRRIGNGGASCSGSRSTAADCAPNPTCSATGRSGALWCASARTRPARDVTSLRTAATVAGVPIEISGPPGGGSPVDVVEDDGALRRRLPSSGS